MLRPLFTPWKEPVPIVQEAGLASGPVWTGGKSRPNRDSIPGTSSPQSLYRLSYPAHNVPAVVLSNKQGLCSTYVYSSLRIDLTLEKICYRSKHIGHKNVNK